MKGLVLVRQKRRYLVESVEILRAFLGDAVRLGECEIEQYYTEYKFKKYVSGENILFIKSSYTYPHGKILTQPVKITEEEYTKGFIQNQSLRKHREIFRLGTALIDVDHFIFPTNYIFVDILDDTHDYTVLEGMTDITGQEEYRNNKIARRC